MGGNAEGAYATFSEQREIGRRFADPDLLTLAGFGQGQALIAMALSAEKIAATARSGSAETRRAEDRLRESEARLSDTIEIGLFTAEPGRGSFDRRNVLTMQRQAVRNGKQVFRFVTDKKPTHAGVDPYNFYIDRNSVDNSSPVQSDGT